MAVALDTSGIANLATMFEAGRTAKRDEETEAFWGDYAKKFAGAEDGTAAAAPAMNLATGKPVESTAPAFAGGSRKMAMPADPEIEARFLNTARAGGLTNPNALAVLGAFGQAESGWSPANFTRTWSDPSQSGAAGTSGGALSWRNERLAAMQKATAGADDPAVAQAKFFLTENPDVTVALQGAKSVGEAHDILSKAWRYAGFDAPGGGEYARRLAMAEAYGPRIAALGGSPAQAPAAPARSLFAELPGTGEPPLPPARPAAGDAPVLTASQGAMPGSAPILGAGLTPPSTAIAETAADLPAPGAKAAEFRVPGDAPKPAAAAPMPMQAVAIAPAQAQALTAAPRANVSMQRMLVGRLLSDKSTRAAGIQMMVALGKEDGWDLKVVGDQAVLFRGGANPAIMPIQGLGKKFDEPTTDDRGRLLQRGPGGEVKVLDKPEASPERRIQTEIATREREADRLGLTGDKRSRYALTGQIADEKEKDEGAKITLQAEARKGVAAGLGMKEGTPEYKGFVGTGKIGRDQELSATDKTAILEADDQVLAIQSTMASLAKAKELSKDAYSGPFASTRGYLGSQVGLERAQKTQELDNTITASALDSLKATFGGAPTEGERKILLDIQGASSQAPEVRAAIYARAEAALQRRLEFQKKRADDLRGGTFYKADGDRKPTEDAPLPKGKDRTPLPAGFSPAMAVQEARDAVKAGRDPAVIRERLRSYGIPPTVLD